MLPCIALVGAPFDQGHTHGQAARDRVRHNIDLYFRRFAHEGLGRDEALARAAAYWPVIQAANPAYARGVEGVAAGAGVPLLEAVMLNVRYEILYDRFNANALLPEYATDRLIDGCTAFAALPGMTADGHLLTGQNWDWIPEAQGLILRCGAAPGSDQPSRLCFTEAGIVGGKFGLNSAGLGLTINGLSTLDDAWARLAKPFHVRCYEILCQRELDAATAVATAGPYSCSANFLIAQAGCGAVDVEASPGAVRVVGQERDLLVHTNHFLDPEEMAIDETPHQRRPYSVCRRDRLGVLLQADRPITVAAVQEALRDHDQYPYSLCRHEDEAAPEHDRFKTVASVVMDLDERRMWVTDGPPCEGEFVEYEL